MEIMKKYYFASLLALTSLSLLISCSNNASDNNDPVDNFANISSTTSGITLDTQLGEFPAPDEEAATRAINEFSLTALKNNTASLPVKRDVHTKHHGCVNAFFQVHNENLDPKYRVGVFAQNKEYKSWIRFSNGQGKPKPDISGDVRGMAVKLMGVPGKKLLENEANEQTQDFLLINNNTFFIEKLSDYTQLIKATAEGDTGVLKFGITHPKVAYRLYNIFKKKISSPIELDYFSTTPYKLGSVAVKYRARPCSDSITPIPNNPSPNYLRETMARSLNQKDTCYNFMVQFRKGSIDDMPVEDSTKEWDESISPFIPVATIIIPRQQFDTDKQMNYCENLSFTPWHSLPEHKPLGVTNRVRKSVYEMISKYRHSQNGVMPKEPVNFNIN
jgi:hypothetical protein